MPMELLNSGARAIIDYYGHFCSDLQSTHGLSCQRAGLICWSGFDSAQFLAPRADAFSKLSGAAAQRNMDELSNKLSCGFPYYRAS